MAHNTHTHTHTCDLLNSLVLKIPVVQIKLKGSYQLVNNSSNEEWIEEQNSSFQKKSGLDDYQITRDKDSLTDFVILKYNYYSEKRLSIFSFPKLVCRLWSCGIKKSGFLTLFFLYELYMFHKFFSFPTCTFNSSFKEVRDKRLLMVFNNVTYFSFQDKIFHLYFFMFKCGRGSINNFLKLCPD